MNDLPRRRRRFPEWLKKPIPGGKHSAAVMSCLSGNRLHTVCVEARCPNRAECYARGTATFLVMGAVCTRGCAFCGVGQGAPLPLDAEEPGRVAAAARSLNLRHIVITSVTRDDLPDGGAGHFAECVRQCRERVPGAAVETLIPDFGGSRPALDAVLACPPDVLGHNVETVPRLYHGTRPGADYRRALDILEYAAGKNVVVKSGLMAGLGETDDEIAAVLRDLGAAGCAMATIGQYLQPSKKHPEPRRFVPPERFNCFENAGRAAGLRCVRAGPYVRSSYRAEEAFAGTAGRARPAV